MRSSFAVVLALGAAAVALHGCGGGGSSPTPAPAGPTPAPAGPTPAPAPPTTTTTTPWLKPSSQNPIRGICYGPLPCTAGGGACGAGPHTPEDMTRPGYANLWSASGRDDLGIIKRIGANIIRLYHPMGEEQDAGMKFPEPDRTQFLDAAKSNRLHVLTGVHQGLPCPNDDCFDSWYNATKSGLTNGFGVKVPGSVGVDTAWHEAVWAVNIKNEVDAMVPGGDPHKYVKQLVSAVDGLLKAESETSVSLSVNPVNLTNCFTTAIEPPLGGGEPSIFHGFSSMENWIKNPDLVPYSPRSVATSAELAGVINRRWFHCINAQIPWKAIVKLIPPNYTKVGMGLRPWIIGEMGFNGEHTDEKSKHNIQHDLGNLTEYAMTGNTTFFGTLFFQFQSAYFKGAGPELNYGMFGLGKPLPYSVSLPRNHTKQVQCLTSRLWAFEGGRGCGPLCNHRAEAVAAAWGGHLSGSGLCLDDVPAPPGAVDAFTVV